jgi:hypothetical protein
MSSKDHYRPELQKFPSRMSGSGVPTVKLKWQCFEPQYFIKDCFCLQLQGNLLSSTSVVFEEGDVQGYDDDGY